MINPTLSFMAACTARRVSCNDAFVIARHTGGVDWSEAQALAARHRVTSLFVDGLAFHGLAAPEPFAAEMSRTARREALSELVMVGEIKRLLGALDEAGVASQILKGVAVSIIAYGKLGLRHNRDVDLLIAHDDVLTALDVLVRAGYRVVEPAGHEDGATLPNGWTVNRKDVTLFHPARRVVVELHWRLFTNTRYSALFSTAGVPVLLPGAVRTSTLEPEANFLFLCAHGAEHAWSRLKWLVDVHAIAATLSTARLDELYAAARARRLHRPVAQALALCHSLFGFPPTKAVAADLRGDLRTMALVRIASYSMTRGGAREMEQSRFGTTLKTVGHYLMIGDREAVKEQLRFDLYFNDHESGTAQSKSLARVLAARISKWASGQFARRGV